METKQVLLKDFSSLNSGGLGELVVVNSTNELVEACMYARKKSKKVCVLGGGTNVYFGEDLLDFLFIKIDIRGISFEDKNDSIYLTAYAGELWDDIVKFSTEKDLWGIENLSYIPGNVGAAPVQNIGAYGSELKDVFVSLSALDTTTLNIVEITKEACNFGYRDSFFKKEKDRYSILSVTLKLSKIREPKLTYKPLDTLIGKNDITSQEVRGVVIATRTAKLPDWHEYPNAGSFFKNPIISKKEAEDLKNKYENIPLIEHGDDYKVPAAWLIEHIGKMKGVRVGDVGTWPNQPLVIVNYGSGTANDIDIFAGGIKTRIKEETGILLEQEVNRIG